MLIENTDQESTHEELLYDVFISYCHRNASAAQTMLSSLHTQNKDLKIFFDYKELKSGQVQEQSWLSLFLSLHEP